jgi:hypothetical protein
MENEEANKNKEINNKIAETIIFRELEKALDNGNPIGKIETIT